MTFGAFRFAPFSNRGPPGLRGIVPFRPRMGGAYDSHHRTAGIAGRTRRRGRVAARGAREQGRRRIETVRLRGFEVDNELDLRDLLHRQLGRMLPFALRMRPVETPTKRLPPVRATVAMVTCPTYFWSQVVSGK